MTEKKRNVRIGRLDTVGHVVTELGKVYRATRQGKMDMGDAKSLTYVLREIRCALEAGDLERRLDALEALGAANVRGPWDGGRGSGANPARVSHESH